MNFDSVLAISPFTLFISFCLFLSGQQMRNCSVDFIDQITLKLNYVALQANHRDSHWKRLTVDPPINSLTVWWVNNGNLPRGLVENRHIYQPARYPWFRKRRPYRRPYQSRPIAQHCKPLETTPAPWLRTFRLANVLNTFYIKLCTILRIDWIFTVMRHEIAFTFLFWITLYRRLFEFENAHKSQKQSSLSLFKNTFLHKFQCVPFKSFCSRSTETIEAVQQRFWVSVTELTVCPLLLGRIQKQMDDTTKFDKL